MSVGLFERKQLFDARGLPIEPPFSAGNGGGSTITIPGSIAPLTIHSGGGGGSSVALTPLPPAVTGTSNASMNGSFAIPVSVPPPVSSSSSVLAAPNKDTQLSFSWENVRVVIDAPDTPAHDRVLLNNVSGSVRPGELLCILGPSGSGKTTLLDILSGRLSAGSDPTLKLSGSRLLNGAAITPQNSDILKHVARYVPQEDHLMGTMTVRETLEFSAQLQLPASMSDHDKKARVDAVLDELGLTVCADTRIGTVFQKGISGGQKRRVSIGIELLTLPQILFCDEPTSGLDSAAAQSVIEVLSRLARGGRVVIATIHQPSSSVFARIDKLYLLSAGLPIFFGDAQQLVPYLADCGHPVPTYANPADFALAIINTDFGTVTYQQIETLNRHFNDSRANKVLVNEYVPALGLRLCFLWVMTGIRC